MAQWKYIGNTTFTNQVSSWLDAVFTLGTKGTYYDGSTRTPGSASAGTYSRFQNNGVTEAVYATPATDTLNLRYIWAGKSTSATPTMTTPDVFANNHAFCSINKNSGSYNAWDDPAPFTSGQFFGYWNAGFKGAAGSGTLYMWECETAVYFASAATGTRHGCLGAWVNPGSTEAADAESDGKLYGVMTTGSQGGLQNLWSTNKTGTVASWFINNTSSTRSHTGIFEPGTGTVKTAYINSALAVSNSAMTQVLPSGKYAVLADSIPLISSGNPQNLLGVLDSMSPFSNAMLGQVLADSGASKDVGYVVGEFTGSAGEAALLLRNQP